MKNTMITRIDDAISTLYGKVPEKSSFHDKRIILEKCVHKLTHGKCFVNATEKDFDVINFKDHTNQRETVKFTFPFPSKNLIQYLNKVTKKEQVDAI